MGKCTYFQDDYTARDLVMKDNQQEYKHIFDSYKSLVLQIDIGPQAIHAFVLQNLPR